MVMDKVKTRDTILDKCIQISTEHEIVLIARFLAFGEHPELVPSKLVAAQREALKEVAE